ncbi:MAG: magnesium transporter CorA family protein [Bacilli bacterium]
MIIIYKTNVKTGILETKERISKGCLISLVKPTSDEISSITERLNISESFITDFLHKKGLPRVDIDENITTFLIDVPIVMGNIHNLDIESTSLGILKISNDYLITVCDRELEILTTMFENTKGDFSTLKESRFIIDLLYRDVRLYQKYIDMIGDKIEKSEDRMLKATKNEDLVGFLTLEKSLVYISKAINANALVFDKIIGGLIIPLYEEDQDLLMDAIMENNQAKSSSSLYRDILNRMTTTVATIISNNLNRIMKFLAGITIVLYIPTIVSSFLGMNVPLGNFEKNPFAFLFLIVLALALSLTVAYILKKKDLL